ncbi:Hypothetical predicted protein [Paramuricea clavata]|uniref:Uncharacterized protein n=1 Tax=Paramuricea clavata TaxID=317549 RepID=A0A6S7I2Q0_PARCT|nr:Hypothetical predicted protein [Paramuricea clavata]
MDDNDEDIFCTSLLDRYASRPNELENMSFAEFAATYTTDCKESDHESIDDNSTIQQSVSSTIKLKNGLGSMRKRKRHCVIRFHKEKSEEEKYRNLIMLYYPWRNEDINLKANFESFKEHFQHIQAIIRSNEAMFSQNADENARAYDDLERWGPPENIWDTVAPNAEYQQAQQQDQGTVTEREIGRDNEPNENVDLVSNSTTANRSEPHERYSAQLGKTLMTVQEYRAMMRSLNKQQLQVLKIHPKWCKDTIIALKHDLPSPV